MTGVQTCLFWQISSVCAPKHGKHKCITRALVIPIDSAAASTENKRLHVHAIVCSAALV